MSWPAASVRGSGRDQSRASSCRGLVASLTRHRANFCQACLARKRSEQACRVLRRWFLDPSSILGASTILIVGVLNPIERPRDSHECNNSLNDRGRIDQAQRLVTSLRINKRRTPHNVSSRRPTWRRYHESHTASWDTREGKPSWCSSRRGNRFQTRKQSGH